jgi:hypothetical protein
LQGLSSRRAKRVPPCAPSHTTEVPIHRAPGGCIVASRGSLPLRLQMDCAVAAKLARHGKGWICRRDEVLSPSLNKGMYQRPALGHLPPQHHLPFGALAQSPTQSGICEMSQPSRQQIVCPLPPKAILEPKLLQCGADRNHLHVGVLDHGYIHDVFQSSKISN